MFPSLTDLQYVIDKRHLLPKVNSLSVNNRLLSSSAANNHAISSTHDQS